MNRMTIMIGLPRSGKSTYVEKIVKENKDIFVVSRDIIRRELFGDKGNMSNEDIVTEKFFGLLNFAVKNKKDIIIDNTSLKRKYRDEFTSVGRKNRYIIKYVFVNTELEVIEERCKDTNFDFQVVRRMIERMDFPTVEEFDEIEISNKETSHRYWEEKHVLFENPNIDSLKGFDQNNPYHKYTLDIHTEKVFRYCVYNINNKNSIFTSYDIDSLSLVDMSIFCTVLPDTIHPLLLSAIFHDFGKLWTRVPNKDNPQYDSYNFHAKYSTYIFWSSIFCPSMNKNNEEFIKNKENIFWTSYIIETHMRYKDEKSKKNVIDNFDGNKELLDIFEKADNMAKGG